jgi:hypothetical protein
MRAPASRDGVKPWRKAAKNVPCKRALRGFFCMAVGTGGHWPQDGTGSPNRRGTFWPSHVVLAVGTKRRRKPWRAIPPGNWAVAPPPPSRSTPSAPPQTAAANRRTPLTVSVAGGCWLRLSEARRCLSSFQASGASKRTAG